MIIDAYEVLEALLVIGNTVLCSAHKMGLWEFLVSMSMLIHYDLSISLISFLLISGECVSKSTALEKTHGNVCI